MPEQVSKQVMEALEHGGSTANGKSLALERSLWGAAGAMVLVFCRP
ncbi:hypothetical protein [Streptomyces klenkii]